MLNEDLETQKKVIEVIERNRAETPAFREWLELKRPAVNKILEGCQELNKAGDSLSEKDILRSQKFNSLEGLIAATIRGNLMALVTVAVHLIDNIDVVNQAFRDNAVDIAKASGGYKIL